MSKQYFMNQPDVEHHERQIEYQLSGIKLKLQTDNGVFSKTQVDYGSRVLVDTVLEDVANVPQSLVELGSGYGPVSLMLAKQWPTATVTGVEINERAWQLSQHNTTTNQVENVSFELADASQWQGTNEVDLVITNPPIRAGKVVIQAFVTNAHQLLKEEGALYVVIQKKQGAPSMQKHMENVFGNAEKITQEKGYWIIKSIK